MNFYELNIVYAIVSVWMYMSFRISIGYYLRHTGNSKTYIRKNKKDFWNYWIYKKIHAEIGLGYVYYLNLGLLALTLLYFLIATSLGWLDEMKIPIAVLHSLLCCTQLPSSVFAHVYDNLEDYGQRFIILRKRKIGGGFDSSILHLALLFVMIAFCVDNFKLALS